MQYGSLPILELQSWARFNGVIFNNIVVADNIINKDGIDKGAGLVAAVGFPDRGFPDNGASQEVLLTVPAALVLSKETVYLCAKADLHLKEILDAVGDFAESPRRAILIFLLFQLARNSPDLVANARGVRGPFADYVAFLPKSIPLPTFYTNEERDLLTGTSLRDAVDQKLVSLDRELEELKDATSHLEWCQKYWWEDGDVTMADWKLVDAMYRSRALDLPTIGHAMVPVLDMANHVSDNKRKARFEVDEHKNVLLVREDGASIEKGEEINITYGAGGACETIFSYGFLDEGATTARELFLSLDIPLDDPLRMAKKVAAKEPAGVRIFVDSDGLTQWEGALIWWAAVNEEDGLDFQVIQSTDGTRELRTLWKNEEVNSTEFAARIAADDNFDIFRLRATVLVQARVEVQGADLVRSEAAYAEAPLRVETRLRAVLNRLRTLESSLLTSAAEALDKQKMQLLMLDTVVRYLSAAAPGHHEEGRVQQGEMEDDFS